MTISSTRNGIKLTLKQEKFVNEYLICGNGAEAARRAQYKERSARQIAAENLTKPVIQAALAAKQVELSEKLNLDRNAVVGGIFMGIAQAREQNDPSGIIKGWIAVSKLIGLDKPETTKSNGLSPADQTIEARIAQMSNAELLKIASGKLIW